MVGEVNGEAVRSRRDLPTREEYISMGMTPTEADHELVRRHELEVVEDNFTRWVMAFGCIICMLLPVSVGLLIFLIYSFISEWDLHCDVPLKEWCVVALVNIVYHVNINGRSIHQQVIRIVCRYEALRQPREPPPARVRIYHFLISTFCFTWHCLGLYWVAVARTCHDTSPSLFKAVRLFAAFNIVFTVFTTISTLGLSRMLASLLRRGLMPASFFHPDRVAPEGTLERQETVEFERCPEGSQCPTCLDDFCKDQKIKRTLCGHYFHEECLVPWLRVNRTCPVCRADLFPEQPQVIGAPAAEEDVEQAMPASEEGVAPAETRSQVGGVSSVGLVDEEAGATAAPFNAEASPPRPRDADDPSSTEQELGYGDARSAADGSAHGGREAVTAEAVAVDVAVDAAADASAVAHSPPATVAGGSSPDTLEADSACLTVAAASVEGRRTIPSDDASDAVL